MSIEAIERLALYFGAEPSRQGYLARQALGRPLPGDPRLVERLRQELTAGIRADGTVAGGVVPTVWRLHELLDLGEPPDSPAITRLATWLLDLQDRPGAFHDGCDRVRHGRRLCQHYIAGFFAPAPPSQRLAPVTLPTGKAFRVEAAARFAISCFALRAVLQAGYGERPAVRRHLQGLAQISEQWTEWSGYFAPDVIVAGLHALAAAGGPQRAEVHRLVDLVTANQGVEGEWPSADLFQVLEALREADTPEARVTVRRAATALVARQRADGTFGGGAQQERALIGLRALLWTARAPA